MSVYKVSRIKTYIYLGLKYRKRINYSTYPDKPATSCYLKLMSALPQKESIIQEFPP